MCIYCGTKNFYKIYENHHGPILKDENSKSFHIHHIDGNHNNNHPDNLKSVSIQEHYNIHFAQGDHGACWKLSKLMKFTKEQLFELNRLQNLKRIKEGTHHFLDKEFQEKMKIFNRKRVLDGSHHMLGGKIQKQLIKEGRHHSQIVHICPHCNKSAKGNMFKSRHFDKCPNKLLIAS